MSADKTGIITGVLSGLVTSVATVTAIGKSKANLSRFQLRSAELFAKQCGAIEAVEGKLPWPQPHWDDSRSYSLGAIVLATAAIEASINELFLEAIDSNTNSLPTLSAAEFSQLGLLWGEVDRFPILRKYELVLAVCGKPSIDRGTETYQSAAGLISLRNALVHFKPEWGTELEEHAKLEGKLSGKFPDSELAKQTTGVMTWFPHRCLGAGCADWAVQSVRHFVTAFCGRLQIPDRLQ